MAKKNREIDIPRLCMAMHRSRLTLRRFRQERVDMVRQYVGNHWSEEGTSEQVPLNLISLYVTTISRTLIAKNPRVMLSIFDRSLKPVVSAMQTWANKEIENMHLDQTLRRIVVDALFSVGLCKVALATPAESAAVAWNLRAGEPFAERVDLDDFVYDIHARDFNEAGYMGHRYRVPLDVVKDSKYYSKARKKLEASPDQLYNLEGDEKISMLGRGLYSTDTEEFEDFVDCWEVYVPRHRVVITLADDMLTGASTGDDIEPLRIQGWLGPDCGPYHVLGYGVVPGNAMPKAPIQDLMDLHEAVNNALRKSIRMTERIKEVTLIQGGAMEDGNRVMEANDGDMIRCDNPDRVKQIIMGGNAVQTVQAMSKVYQDLFSFMGGNLELLGGRGPQSKTAHQDEMLNENAGASIADMQDRTVNFAAEVIKALCWYWCHDPLKVQTSKHSLPSVPEMTIKRQVTPKMRRSVPWDEMDIETDPYSMQHSTPQKRMAALSQVVQQVVLPMAQQLQAQGVAFDINAYLKKMASYMDMPDLAEIVTIQEPPEDSTNTGAGEEPTKPAETTRNYVRESMPGRTTKGNDQQMVASMLGHDLGGAQKNGAPQ